MNISQIESNVSALVSGLSSGTVPTKHFLYELLLAYGHRKQSVTRLKSGERNLASRDNSAKDSEAIWKRHVYFKHIDGRELHSVIDHMRNEKLVATNKIRFIIVTNFEHLLAVDTKTLSTLDIELEQLSNQFDFFLPWAGMEKAIYQGEHPADVKAAEKMAKLFDLIKADNFDESNSGDINALHDLNIFLTRLLFCFFAEDTGIFKANEFSLAVKSHTHEDGTDLSEYLNRLFNVLNTADFDRGPLPDYLVSFPYVNGGLFNSSIITPAFSRKSRRVLIECGGELDWSDINPDIFGSMIQAVVHPDQRGGMGMHYTSVTNIMKVIEPLFLNDLYKEFEAIENSTSKLSKLQQRLSEIKIFDPACGSGNFLIIAYKELRKLEMEMLKRMQELELDKTGQMSQPFSVIKLSQFFGIELDDFAHEVAILSLWLAEHQMNVDFKVDFGYVAPSLPLKSAGNIVSGDSLLVDWADVCPNDENSEVFLLGNPPYLGSSMQNKVQKENVSEVFKGTVKYKTLDYIAAWFWVGSKYIDKKPNCRLAFVSTNSICQGEQVSLLWPGILKLGLEIGFCYRSFLWKNSAQKGAAVSCIILSLRNVNGKAKYIYDGAHIYHAKNINAYLQDSENIYIARESQPISPLPRMIRGNSPFDGGHLIFETSELNALPEIVRSKARKLVGAREFVNNNYRHCLWVSDDEYEDLSNDDCIKEIFNKVSEFRLASSDMGTRKMSNISHRFRDVREAMSLSILIPRVGSSKRSYLPIGLYPQEFIILDSAQVIYDAEPWVFGLLSSRMHFAWFKATAGRLKNDYRYSSVLCWNTFPAPRLTTAQMEKLNVASMNLIGVREKHPDKSIADIYKPLAVPQDVIGAHEQLDTLVDSFYSEKGFPSDNERLDNLFKLYISMTEGRDA